MLQRRISIICLINDLTREKVPVSTLHSFTPSQSTGPGGRVPWHGSTITGFDIRDDVREAKPRLIHPGCLSDATPDISGPTFCGDETMSSFNVFTAFSRLVTHSEEVRFGSGDPEDDDSLLRRKVAQ